MSNAIPPSPTEGPPNFQVIEKVAEKAAESPLPESGSDALSEQRALFRVEQTRDTVHTILIWGLRVLGLIAIAVVTLRIAHLALPLKCQFMSDAQTAHIDSLFLSGSIAVAISKHFKSVMGWDDRVDD